MTILTKFGRAGLSVLMLSALPVILAAPASAQSFNDVETQVRIGFTVPFGAHQKTVKTKPRLEFGFRTVERATPQSEHWAWREISTVPAPPAQFALTLGKDPEFLLAGEPLYFEDDQADLNKPTKVALGAVGIAAGVVVVFSAVYLIVLNESLKEGGA